MKFKREERSNRALVDKHLREVALFDASVFDDDNDEDETDEEGNGNAENGGKGKGGGSRKRSAAAKAGAAEKAKRRRRGRRRVSNRNYYSSSDDADGELSEQSQSARVESTEDGRPQRRSSRRYTDERRPWIQSESEGAASQEDQVVAEEEVTTTTSSEHPRTAKETAEVVSSHTAMASPLLGCAAKVESASPAWCAHCWQPLGALLQSHPPRLDSQCRSSRSWTFL